MEVVVEREIGVVDVCVGLIEMEFVVKTVVQVELESVVGLIDEVPIVVVFSSFAKYSIEDLVGFEVELIPDILVSSVIEVKSGFVVFAVVEVGNKVAVSCKLELSIEIAEISAFVVPGTEKILFCLCLSRIIDKQTYTNT